MSKDRFSIVLNPVAFSTQQTSDLFSEFIPKTGRGRRQKARMSVNHFVVPS